MCRYVWEGLDVCQRNNIDKKYIFVKCHNISTKEDFLILYQYRRYFFFIAFMISVIIVIIHL